MTTPDPPSLVTLAHREGLATRIGGPVLVSGEDGYDTGRVGFQTAGAHRPGLIIGACDASDVATAVVFAGTHGVPIAVQATGHGLSATAEHDAVLIGYTGGNRCRMPVGTDVALPIREVGVGEFGCHLSSLTVRAPAMSRSSGRRPETGSG
jgi:hypothetical protein